MLQIGIRLIWLTLFHYYIEQIGELEKGYVKKIVLWGITYGVLLAVHLPFPRWGGPWHNFTGGLVITLTLFLYMLFYDAKPLTRQWWKVLVPGILLAFSAMGQELLTLMLWNGVFMIVLLLLLSMERGYLCIRNGLLQIGIYGLLICALWYFRNFESMGLGAGILVLEWLLFLALEGALYSYQRGFEVQTERFQRDILGQQYEEIKEIYLNMRSWRHDYHNHLQVMKAQLWAGRVEEMRKYLNELEITLDSVDTYVKSGNLMADAILNSKLSLARQKGIQVNCKAVLPEVISIEDVDLCVLLGNLLDNALEACEQIPVEGRFLRVYMVVNKAQLYASIQNSAKEELNFNERHYISTKKGNHGLGMKRVKALIDKYEGYLNLANEPGIFAAELTLPL
ncbi:MAG: GHKL domain-containing protein [Lachnospiraceae bacterium]|nr:GHKL domain-containing protein [Lachnospiraceae bacterium]